MMMRLLKKDEIAKAVNADRSREIAEGLKIANRVDSLRGTWAEEEKKIEKYRSESLAAIQSQIADAAKQRDEIQREYKQTKKALESETTLTKQERLHLEDLKQTLTEKDAELKEASYELDLKEIDIACAIKDANEKLSLATQQEEAITRLRDSIAQNLFETNRKLTSAKLIEEKAVRLREDTEKELEIRDMVLRAKEKSVFEQEEENQKKAKELEIEKIQVADQRATLERSISRLRQNRLA